MSRFDDDLPFPEYDDHGQVTTTIGDLRLWLESLEEHRQRNNLPRSAFTDDTPISIGRSYHGNAEIFVHITKGVRHSFGFFDRVRDKAFHTAAKRAHAEKKTRQDAQQLAYRDAWKDYPEFSRTELDEMHGGPC